MLALKEKNSHSFYCVEFKNKMSHKYNKTQGFCLHASSANSLILFQLLYFWRSYSGRLHNSLLPLADWKADQLTLGIPVPQRDSDTHFIDFLIYLFIVNCFHF